MIKQGMKHAWYIFLGVGLGLTQHSRNRGHSVTQTGIWPHPSPVPLPVMSCECAEKVTLLTVFHKPINLDCEWPNLAGNHGTGQAVHMHPEGEKLSTRIQGMFETCRQKCLFWKAPWYPHVVQPEHNFWSTTSSNNSCCLVICQTIDWSTHLSNVWLDRQKQLPMDLSFSMWVAPCFHYLRSLLTRNTKLFSNCLIMTIFLKKSCDASPGAKLGSEGTHTHTHPIQHIISVLDWQARSIMLN